MMSCSALSRIIVAVAGFALLAGCGGSEPEVAGGPPVMRRLTAEQYRQVIADVFGDDIVIGGRFDPILRSNGLLAVGASNSAINGSAFERYEAMARSIAGQVTDAAHRDVLLPCKPADIAKPDDECARAFFKGTGRLLYRRSLTEEELNTLVQVSRAGADKLGDFYAGVSAALTAMMVRPEFLFITDQVEPDPKGAGKYRLTALSKAARISFFLWNTTPDEALLASAESGALNEDAETKRQVDRMLASPRLAGGARAFFNDMFALDGFETLQKDAIIYPAFGLAATEQSREQLLRTIVDHLVARKGSYPDLFTTRHTFMTADLGVVYRMPVSQPLGWVPYEFPEGDSHQGIHSLAGFVALFSHPGRSSATIRGKAIREVLMCQMVPDPPGNVDFSAVQDVNDPVNRTARQRLSAHATNPTCAGCHKIMDPVGLSLEKFDGAGQWREIENETAIDISGDLDGIPYKNMQGLGQALAQNPAVPACLVKRAYAYGVGRPLTSAERRVTKYLREEFAKADYRFPDLLREIVLSKAFTAVSPPPVMRAETRDKVKDRS
jgi:hypothetical protein